MMSLNNGFRAGRSLIPDIPNKRPDANSDVAVFKGLQLRNDLGQVALPLGCHEALLDKKVFAKHIKHPDGAALAYINKPKLQGVLLETNGGEIFRAMRDRLIVVARVGNIHVPFYMKKEGSKGVQVSNWYPFFGYTGSEVVDGSKDVIDKPSYHGEISRVQEILNKNLILPIDIMGSGGTVDWSIGEGIPRMRGFDLGLHLKFKESERSEFTKHPDGDKAFVEAVTGYMPRAVAPGETTWRWISDIVSQIRT